MKNKFSVSLLLAGTIFSYQNGQAQVKKIAQPSAQVLLKVNPQLLTMHHILNLKLQKIAPVVGSSYPQVTDFPPYSASYNPRLTNATLLIQTGNIAPSPDAAQFVLFSPWVTIGPQTGNIVGLTPGDTPFNSLIKPNSSYSISLPLVYAAHLHDFIADPQIFVPYISAGDIWITASEIFNIPHIALSLTFEDGVTKTMNWNNVSSAWLLEFSGTWQTNTAAIPETYK